MSCNSIIIVTVLCYLSAFGSREKIQPKRTVRNVRNFFRNRKLEISTAPTRAKKREPAYSPALIQKIINRQGVQIQRVRQIDSERALVDACYLELRRGGREKR